MNLANWKPEEELMGPLPRSVSFISVRSLLIPIEILGPLFFLAILTKAFVPPIVTNIIFLIFIYGIYYYLKMYFVTRKALQIGQPIAGTIDEILPSSWNSKLTVSYNLHGLKMKAKTKWHYHWDLDSYIDEIENGDVVTLLLKPDKPNSIVPYKGAFGGMRVIWPKKPFNLWTSWRNLREGK